MSRAARSTPNDERGIARQAAESTRRAAGGCGPRGGAHGGPHPAAAGASLPRLPDGQPRFLLVVQRQGLGARPGPAFVLPHHLSLRGPHSRSFHARRPVAALGATRRHAAGDHALHDLVPLLYPRALRGGRYGGQRGSAGCPAWGSSALPTTSSPSPRLVGGEMPFELLECDREPDHRDRRRYLHADGIDGFVSRRRRPRSSGRGSLGSALTATSSDVGGGDRRKNVRGLIEAYGLLPARLRERHQARHHLRASPEGGRTSSRPGASDPWRPVLLAGFVADRGLAALYRRCGFFVFPSVIRARACRSSRRWPAVRRSSGAPLLVPEILGDLRATFDPSDPAEIAACVARTLDESRARAPSPRLRRADRPLHLDASRARHRGLRAGAGDAQPPRHAPRAAEQNRGLHAMAARALGAATYSRRSSSSSPARPMST